MDSATFQQKPLASLCTNYSPCLFGWCFFSCSHSHFVFPLFCTPCSKWKLLLPRSSESRFWNLDAVLLVAVVAFKKSKRAINFHNIWLAVKFCPLMQLPLSLSLFCLFKFQRDTRLLRGLPVLLSTLSSFESLRLASERASEPPLHANKSVALELPLGRLNYLASQLAFASWATTYLPTSRRLFFAFLCANR